MHSVAGTNRLWRNAPARPCYGPVTPVEVLNFNDEVPNFIVEVICFIVEVEYLTC